MIRTQGSIHFLSKNTHAALSARFASRYINRYASVQEQTISTYDVSFSLTKGMQR